MGVTAMRFLMIAAAATVLMLPATAPAKAYDTAVHSVTSTDLSATKHHKKQKKPMRAKKEKVEYMRAAPMK
jgi:hypothetical protein